MQTHLKKHHIKLIDKGEIELLEIRNYHGKDCKPYLSSEQILELERHCNAKGYKPQIYSAVDVPKGQEFEYEERYHSSDAIKSRGYTTFQTTIKHKNGVTSEFQLRAKLVDEFSEGAEHDIYALFENKSLSDGNPEIDKVVEPLKTAIKSVDGNKALEDKYYGYLNDYYTYLRKTERGISAEKPTLPNGLDPILDIASVSEIHKQIKAIKDANKPQAEAKPNEVKPNETGAKYESPETIDVTEQIKNMTDEEFVTRKANILGENPEIKHITKETIILAEKLCANKDFSTKEINNILLLTHEKNLNAKLNIYEQLSADKEFPKEHIAGIIFSTFEDNISLTKSLCTDKDFPKQYIANIIRLTNNKNMELTERLCADKDFPKEYIANIIRFTNDKNIELAQRLCADKDFPQKTIASILQNTNEKNLDAKLNIYELLIANKEFPKDQIPHIIYYTNNDNISFAKRLCTNKDFQKEYIANILKTTYQRNLAAKSSIYEQLSTNKELPKDQIPYIIYYTNNDNISLTEKFCADKDFPKKYIATIIKFTTDKNIKLAEKLCSDKDFPKDRIAQILYTITANTANLKLDMYETLSKDGSFSKEQISHILSYQRGKTVDMDITVLEDLYNLPHFKDNVKSVEKLRQQILSNPKLYINGELGDSKELESKINRFIDYYGISLTKLVAATDKETLNYLFRKRFTEAGIFLKDSATKISLSEWELITKLNSSLSQDGKALMPTNKIEIVNLVDAYKSSGLDMSKMQAMADAGKVDLSELRMDLFNGIMKNSGLTDEEIASIPTEKIASWDIEYSHLLAKELKGTKDTALSDIIRAGNFTDFNTYIHDTSNIYGKTNTETKKQYQEMSIDYDKWVKPSKENEIHFVAQDTNSKRLYQVASQIAEDMNNLMQTPIKGFLKKQFPKCIKDDEFVIPHEYLTSKAKLEEFVKILSDTSEQGQMAQVWKRAKGNVTNSDPARGQAAKNTLTVLEHLNQIVDDISKIEEEIEINDNGKKKKKKITEALDVTVKMWDRNPQKDIFQGNYSTCCIGMGHGNGSAMPHYVLNTSFNMIELVDNKTGNIIGNALCYFVKDSDGKPAFIIDNIEINNGAKPSDGICKQLREQMALYASRVAKEVTGRDNTNIYMSANYNDVPIDDLIPRTQKVSFLGDIDCKKIYLDLFHKEDEDGWINTLKLTDHDCELLKLEP